MRCYCCDKQLTDYEATLLICSTDEFADTCLKCLEGLGINVKGNSQLKRRHDELNPEYEAQLDDELKELIQQQRDDYDWDGDE